MGFKPEPSFTVEPGLYLRPAFRLAGILMFRSALVLALVLVAGAAPAADADFKEIFNGSDLAGWEGDPRYWAVEDGILRGETTLASLPTQNTFLIWRRGLVRDFDLRVKFRIRNGNSGIQYRSKDLGRFRVSGYQAEIENKQGKVGFLYQEKGRKYLANVGEKVEIGADGKRVVGGELAPKEALVARGYYKAKEWNEYRIVAQGNRLRHWLNGFQTVELVDHDANGRSLEGILALQIHAGPPMLVEFRDILLKKL